MRGARAGSPRKTSAIATETTGAVPNTIETRDAPESRIAIVTRIWAAPGERSPASRNGQAELRCRPRDGAYATPATTATPRAVAAVVLVPAAAAGSRSGAL